VCPKIRPVDGLIDGPAGSPVALPVRVWPESESVALIFRLTEAPTAVFWSPGLLAVTVLPVVVPLVNAVVPSGVPQPAGPLYPTSAVHR
jgi:hypothetical protein